MLENDKLWLPHVLEGRKVIGNFVLDDNNKVESCFVQPFDVLKPEGKECTTISSL